MAEEPEAGVVPHQQLDAVPRAIGESEDVGCLKILPLRLAAGSESVRRGASAVVVVVPMVDPRVYAILTNEGVNASEDWRTSHAQVVERLVALDVWGWR